LERHLIDGQAQEASMQSTNAHWQAGFTLIEAMIAMLVLAFGMLAIAGLQTALAHNSDTAKQRTEATRLAQAKIEQLRSFEQVASGVGKYSYTENIVSGADTVSPAASSASNVSATTNTAYARTWTVTPSIFDTTVRVAVDWVDRQGQPQSVLLSSVISKSDPMAAGVLSVAPPVPAIKTPYHGMPPIPTVGKYIGDGKSAIQLPGTGPASYIVFDNTVDAMVFRCNGTVTTSTVASDCTTPSSAFLVTGFISGLPASFNADDAQASATTLTLVGGGSTAECFVFRVPTTGNFPRDPGSPAPTAFASTFFGYLCLIPPDATGTWSGSLKVIKRPGFPSLMQTGDLICRLSWDQDGSGPPPGNTNREHRDPYVSVSESLQGQNFRYVPTSTSPTTCPASENVNGIDVTYALVNVI
jgi:type IV pilus modification protein PilV